MAARRVFLTGATGHVGGAVLAELVRSGFDVVALVRTPVTLEGCRTVVGHLADIDRLTTEISRAEAVVHLASPREFDPDSALRDDILGTANLIAAWRGAGPFIYISSPTVQRKSPTVLTEASPIDLSNWYDVQKFVNEFQVRFASAARRGAAGITLRPGFFFGPSERRDGRQFLSAVFEHCEAGGNFVYESQAAVERYGSSFIGPADFGRAVVAALSLGAPSVFNVSGGFCTWKTLIETINRHAGTSAGHVIRPDAQPEAGEFRLFQSRTFLDTTAFDTQTAFVASQTLDELVHGFVVQARSWKTHEVTS